MAKYKLKIEGDDKTYLSLYQLKQLVFFLLEYIGKDKPIEVDETEIPKTLSKKFFKKQ